MQAAMAGAPLAGAPPVTVLYCHLYQQDHFAELTGRPPWELWQWLYASPGEHLETFRGMLAQAPFDIVQPHAAPSRQARENTQFVVREGKGYRYDRSADRLEPLAATGSGHATDYAANEVRRVFDRADVTAQVRVTPARELLASGANDYLDATVSALGEEEFILSGGVIGTVYSCGEYVGQSNAFSMMLEEPDLLDYLSWRIVEQNLERIRQLASAGGDAIFIDDATATSDMISVAHYERFSVPYLKAMVEEIHRLGHKAILIYFGGIGDRLEQIASVGADALAMEASMKGYVNDVDEIAGRIGDRMTLFGNVDPIGVLEKGSEEELAAEVSRQLAAGRRARGFVACTGSPITPATPLARVRRFIALARQVGSEG